MDLTVSLWRLVGDPEPASAQVTAALEAGDPGLYPRAVAVAKTMGPVAAGCVPALRRFVDDRARLWLAVDAAIAMWRISGEPEPTVTALLELSTTALKPRQAIGEFHANLLSYAAKCFAEIGPAAEVAAPLLAAELARPRRRDIGAGNDIELCHDCRSALDSIFEA
ncbi:hypothetical protein OHA40_31650 [Nocardia sp. NBC_00508]|uniref:hypothetical protein n=1 Tax=Nocardia sp. NBC_00508 TaxID=2975992 RepID=UPI002E8031FC|nr:hypothetical protein [Nocardia sp. NBC_00508]WUD66077.1 hypothetical protein OHA40_31650 [Nocardia sp. NBC_00508]